MRTVRFSSSGRSAQPPPRARCRHPMGRPLQDADPPPPPTSDAGLVTFDAYWEVNPP